MKMQVCWTMVLCGALFFACGGEGPKGEKSSKSQRQVLMSPTGTWYLYAGSESGPRTENMDSEVTILVLDDSTYTLTLLQPKKQLNFVEKGTISYNNNSATMNFVVFSSTGVDFSGAEPRKLVDVEQVVAWERAAGVTYKMTWRTEWQHDEEGEGDREVLVLESDNYETTFFVRLKNSDAATPELDANLKDKVK
ncbi:MAG: hypothetical protein O3B73_07755 [bacterium]|nr:hypothetical protein [bacterium]